MAGEPKDNRRKAGGRRGGTDPLAQETKLLKALGHPIRRKIFAMLDDAVASPKDIAEQLGANLSYISYHVRALYEAGLIERTHTRQRRGAEQTFYRARQRPLLSTSLLKQLLGIGDTDQFGEAIEAIVRDIAAAADAKALDANFPPRTFRRTVLVDAEGWAELAKLLQQAEARVAQLKRRSMVESSPADAVRASLAVLLYEAGERCSSD